MTIVFGRVEVIHNPEQFQWKRDKAEASLELDEERMWYKKVDTVKMGSSFAV